MPAERLVMCKVREILRLKFGAGLAHKAIARSLGIAASTVRLTLQRAVEAGFTWPLADELTDAVLEQRLYGAAGTKQGHRRRPEPNWAMVHRELKRKHVTLSGSRTATGTAVMLRPDLCGLSQGEGWFPWLEPQHNFRRDDR